MTNTVLAALPISREFDNSSVQLAGGQLFTYAAGSTTPLATYQDLAGNIPNTNPIVLDTTGRAIVRYQAGTAYKLVLQDSQGNTLWTLDNYYPPVSDAGSIGLLLYPQTTAEIAAAVTPVSYQYPQGDVRRYGAVLNGTSDDTTALLNWAKVPGRHTFPTAQSALISATIQLVSNSTYEFADGGTITTATHDIALFNAFQCTNITVRGGSFTQTSAGTVGNYLIGGVVLNTCSYCAVEDCIFTGMQWSGVLLLASQYCTVRACTFLSFLGTLQDAADVAIISNNINVGSHYNVVTGNFCYGGGEHGISCEDPYSGTLTTRNVITNNRIGAHTGYGILVYQPDSGDSFNQILGNEIEGITGNYVTNNSSGAGIYVVGNGSGGTQIIGNVIKNCCINTANASLAPAGIGISGTPAGGVPVVVEGNIIEGMTQYHGILLTGVAAGGSVIGNSIRMPTQTGTVGDGIQIANCDNVSVAGNKVTLLSTTTAGGGISCNANGAACNNITIANNVIKGGHATQIRCLQSGGNQCQNISISGNQCNSGDNTNVPFQLDSAAAINVTVTGNIFRGGTATVINHVACQSVRYSNNYVNGTGAAMLTSSGTCTGSYYDLSNSGTTDATTSNGGTGLIVEQFGSAAPASGTHAIGDLRRNTSPSAAGVLLWVTTTAGAGTWKTVSNT
jgi:hypothetical protein